MWKIHGFSCDLIGFIRVLRNCTFFTFHWNSSTVIMYVCTTDYSCFHYSRTVRYSSQIVGGFSCEKSNYRLVVSVLSLWRLNVQMAFSKHLWLRVYLLGLFLILWDSVWKLLGMNKRPFHNCVGLKTTTSTVGDALKLLRSSKKAVLF